MGKARKALKFSAAGAMTSLFGLTIYQVAVKKLKQAPVAPYKVAATAGVLIAMTWTATLL